MSLINCNSDCIYQKDGSCTLDNVQDSITLSDDTSCVHYIKKQKKLNNIQKSKKHL